MLLVQGSHFEYQEPPIPWVIVSDCGQIVFPLPVPATSQAEMVPPLASTGDREMGEDLPAASQCGEKAVKTLGSVT